MSRIERENVLARQTLNSLCFLAPIGISKSLVTFITHATTCARACGGCDGDPETHLRVDTQASPDVTAIPDAAPVHLNTARSQMRSLLGGTVGVTAFAAALLAYRHGAAAHPPWSTAGAARVGVDRYVATAVTAAVTAAGLLGAAYMVLHAKAADRSGLDTEGDCGVDSDDSQGVPDGTIRHGDRYHSNAVSRISSPDKQIREQLYRCGENLLHGGRLPLESLDSANDVWSLLKSFSMIFVRNKVGSM